MKMNDRGFSIIEVLTAAAVAVVTFTALNLSLANANQLTRNNINTIRATNAITEELLELRRTNYDTMAAMATPSTFTNTELAKLPGGVGTIYLEDSFGDDIKKVTLHVSWNANGRTVSQSVSTYVSRRGINGV